MKRSRQRKDDDSEHAGRYYDNRFDAMAVKVAPGEFVATGEDVMLVTLLGSCVSACIRDPRSGIGGMNHFLLPDAGLSAPGNDSARYGSYAMEMMINELLKRGARREHLEAKVFGGGAVLAGMKFGNVGERNCEFVLRYLQDERIPVLAADLGDIVPRRVHYFPRDGRALVRRLPITDREAVRDEEVRYLKQIRQQPKAGSVELF
nr:chemoreceptor glutamine deamidase CheD [Solimonas aquatica]